MGLDIDFVAYMRVIGAIMALVAVVGYFVVGASLREHNQRREEKLADSRSRQTWDSESPGSFGRELHGDAGSGDHRDSRNKKAGLSQLSFD